MESSFLVQQLSATKKERKHHHEQQTRIEEKSIGADNAILNGHVPIEYEFWKDKQGIILSGKNC